MRYLIGFVCVLALSIVGCSETAGTGGSGGVGGQGGDGGSGGEGGSTETATLQILPMELDADGEQVRLAGVRVCELDTDNCGVTDGEGALELEMPANREISYTQKKDGYDSELRSDVMPPKVTIVIPVMATAASVGEMYDGLVSPYPMEGTGAVYVTVWAGAAGPPIPGATVELVDGTGKIFYIDDDGTWRSDLAATTSAGVGGFVEVSLGEVQVKIGGAAKDCEVFRGWPGESPNTVRMLVREGFTTSPRVLCSD